jgi:hypothetical protein
MLAYNSRAASKDVAKVIRSAAANAEHNYSLDAGSLRITKLDVDGGPIRKGGRAGSRSHSRPMFHRTSHIICVVTDEGKPRQRGLPPAALSPFALRAQTPRRARKLAAKQAALETAASTETEVEQEEVAKPKKKSGKAQAVEIADDQSSTSRGRSSKKDKAKGAKKETDGSEG